MSDEKSTGNSPAYEKALKAMKENASLNNKDKV
jgi:hypothetical protein